MALWQNATDPGETWDDGETAQPGEEGFSTARVSKKWGAAKFNYMGTPNWTPPVDETP